MSVTVLRTIREIRDHLANVRHKATVGCVATMGALHEGHAALIHRARRECDFVVVTIFVNRIQFNQSADFECYPRSLERDVDYCDPLGVDIVFAPDETEMYPTPTDTHVEVSRLTDHLCGASRPGHFRGVTTVVMKLFEIIQPHRAYFGEKDAQQLAVIRRMVRDLNVPVTIVGVPIVREPDGLALSSRNQHLSQEERRMATVLYRALEAARTAAGEGECRAGTLKKTAKATLAEEPDVRLDYLEVVDADEMQPIETLTGPARIAVAAWVGETRLIDNIAVSPAESGGE
jgi:pantoate--beta-alanine ligase